VNYPALPTQARPGALVSLTRLRVLLVEDDDADAFLVEELLAEAQAAVDLTIVRTVAQARAYFDDVDCVLLDLGLPDAQGIDGLRRVLAEAKRVAVCVLTGRQDAHLGIAAVAEGAQDYLVKGHVDGVLLARALQYAVERKRADENAGRLREVELRQAESARLERGLLPKPLMTTDLIGVETFYRPGRQQAVIGGDFFDVVQTAPNVLHAMIGDVSGHGVDEAALGVLLRVAWRALTLGRVPDEEVLPALEQVLASERGNAATFATVATARIELDSGRATFLLAGHPPPLLFADGGVRPVPAPHGLLLGMGRARRQTFELQLPASGWSLLLYTDGLIEGRIGSGDERLGIERLADWCVAEQARGGALPRLPAWLVEQAELANSGPLADDVAILLLTGRPRR
jgi:serine phosphatase RsbU (regulator of sigma subunit)